MWLPGSGKTVKKPKKNQHNFINEVKPLLLEYFDIAVIMLSICVYGASFMAFLFF